MKVETILLSLLLVAILFVGCTQQQPPAQGPNSSPTQTPPNTTPTKDELCAQSGGTVTTQFCCKSVDDFPNTCLIGACGCSHDDSHNVKVCDCGEGKCWNASQNACAVIPAAAQPNNPSNSPVGMDQIYQFGSLHSYAYNLTSTSQGQTTSVIYNTTITSDTVNGTAAWLQQTDITMQGGTITSKMWVDKVTFKCLQISSVVSYGDQTINQPGQCPTTGPNSASNTGTTVPTLTYIGAESVTVPAGTFTSNKYSLSGVTYWSATGVPVPIKIAYDDGSMTMELVSYSS